jgi:hypothetical protein
MVALSPSRRDAAPFVAQRWKAWLSHQWRALMAAAAVGGVMFWGCPTVAAKRRLAGRDDAGAGGEISP